MCFGGNKSRLNFENLYELIGDTLKSGLHGVKGRETFG
jgi:hypothetical protein